MTLVEAYEWVHFPMDLPGTVEAIKFRTEQSGLTIKDLEPVIGRPVCAERAQLPPLRRFSLDTMRAWIAEDEADFEKLSRGN